MVSAANTENSAAYAMPPVSTPPPRAPKRALARAGRVCFHHASSAFARSTSERFGAASVGSGAIVAARAWAAPAPAADRSGPPARGPSAVMSRP